MSCSDSSSAPALPFPGPPPSWLGGVDLITAVFDHLPLGVMVIDLEGRIIYCNETQAQIDGLDREFIVGKLETEVYGPYLGPGIMRSCQQTRQSLLGYACHYRTVQGKIVHGAYWVYPCLENGLVMGSVCLTQPLPDHRPRLAPDSRLEFQPEGTQTEGEPPDRLVIVGSDPAFRRALSVAQTTADSPSAVLLSGETGTGKELFARAIRQAGSRHAKPFQAINCAAIPATLLEGILFGATRGSFTGATERPGLFEAANEGIVYLDEIDSLPLELQPKLLRVIQEMRVRRLGSAEERPIDVKIISSISTGPAEALSSRRLRPDLYYRLAVITVAVPPLRERLGDLDDLISHFIGKYNRLLNKNVAGLDDEVWASFHNYHWPGNVRELEHLIAGAVNLTAWETTLHLHHLPDHHRLSPVPLRPLGRPRPAALEPGPPGSELTADEAAVPVTLAGQEAEAIKKALRRTGGRLGRAAELLGISRQLLSYKIKKHRIQREAFRPRLDPADWRG